jgi:CTD small phosphatase-like protein 2
MSLRGPILPPKASYQPKHTLVLDMDDTMLFCDQSSDDTFQIYKRPGLALFLEEMSHIFEIIVFTAANREYADTVLNSLRDCKFYISHRLYWDHITVAENVSEGGVSDSQEQMTYYKDLSKLGRDLSKTIIVDNLPENFSLQPENGI